MAKFKSDTESKKWKSLEATTSTSFHKMLQGTATESDFKSVSKILEQQSALAKSVFDEGVKSIEATADELLDKVNQGRIESGKRPLTQQAHNRLHKSTMQDVMRNYAPDIIASLKDIIDDRFDEIAQGNVEAITKGFDKLSGYSPTRKPVDTPSTDDIIALQEAASEDADNKDNAKWPDRLADIKKAVGDAVENSLLEIIKRVKGNQSKPGMQETSPALGYSPTARANANNWELMDADGGSSAMSQATATSPTVQLTPKTEAAIYEATDEQKTFMGSIRDMLANLGNKDKEKDSPEEEEKKASSWLRKMGSWMKDKMPSKKSRGTIMSIIKGIGQGLFLALTAPSLIKGIAGAAKEFLTLDNLEKVIKTTWDTIYGIGGSIVSGILKEFGLKGSPNPDVKKPALERMDTQISNAQTKLKSAQDAKAKAGGDESKLTDRQRQDLAGLPEFIKRLQAGRTEEAAKENKGKPPGTTAPSASAGTLPGGGSATTTVGSSPVASAKSAIVPAGASPTVPSQLTAVNQTAVTDSGGYTYDAASGKIVKLDSQANPTNSTVGGDNYLRSSGNTTVAPATSPTTGKGLTVPDPALQTAQADTTPSRPGGGMQSSTAITLASFGMHAGVDDTLQLMNVGAIA